MTRISQAILIFDTLQKRKLLLDMIGKRLDIHYGLRWLISHFPAIFVPLFLFSGTLKSIVDTLVSTIGLTPKQNGHCHFSPLILCLE